jgi:hypothetical protein
VLSANFVGTYANKVLTQTTPAEIVIDGVTLALADRVLLIGQTDKTQNGIYTVTTLGVTSGAAGVLTRALDWDDSADVVQGVKIPVAEGTANADTTYVLTTEPPYTLGSTNLEFAKDSGSLARVVQLEHDITGNGTNTEFTFSHDLGTKDLITELYDTASGETVEAQITRASANDVKVTFGAAPLSSETYRLIIHAWQTV